MINMKLRIKNYLETKCKQLAYLNFNHCNTLPMVSRQNVVEQSSLPKQHIVEKIDKLDQLHNQITTNRNKLYTTFPEPRKPVIIVAGIRSSGGIFAETSKEEGASLSAASKPVAKHQTCRRSSDKHSDRTGAPPGGG